VALARSVTPANTLRLSGPVAEDQKEVAQAAVTAGAEVPSSRVKAQVVAICVAAREARMDKMDVRGAEAEVEVTMHVVQAECSYVRELGVMEVTVAAAEGDPGAVVTAVLGAGVVHRLVVRVAALAVSAVVAVQAVTGVTAAHSVVTATVAMAVVARASVAQFLATVQQSQSTTVRSSVITQRKGWLEPSLLVAAKIRPAMAMGSVAQFFRATVH
jgi:hypothetical protein